METVLHYGINTAGGKKTGTLLQHMFHWESDKHIGLDVNKQYLPGFVKLINPFRILTTSYLILYCLESVLLKIVMFLPERDLGNRNDKLKHRLHFLYK